MSKRARNSKEKGVLYGLNVFGVTRIFCNQRTVISKRDSKKYTFEEYTTSVSRKDENGKYTNIYIPVYFEKGLDKPENNSLIRLQESNLFVSGNKGYERIALYVKQWDYYDEE